MTIKDMQKITLISLVIVGLGIASIKPLCNVILTLGGIY